MAQARSATTPRGSRIAGPEATAARGGAATLLRAFDARLHPGARLLLARPASAGRAGARRELPEILEECAERGEKEGSRSRERLRDGAEILGASLPGRGQRRPSGAPVPAHAYGPSLGGSACSPRESQPTMERRQRTSLRAEADCAPRWQR